MKSIILEFISNSRFFTVWLDAYVSERQYAARKKITSKAKQTKRFPDISFRVRVPFEISDVCSVL